MSEKQTGTVKWFNDSNFKEIQGSGFKTLAEGQKVEFIPARGAKGMQATQIMPL